MYTRVFSNGEANNTVIAKMPVEVLGIWGRLGIISIGASIILISIVLVICFVNPGCLLYRYFFGDGREKRRRKSREKDKLMGFDPPMIYYKAADTPPLQEPDCSLPPTLGPMSQVRRLTPPLNQNGTENQSLLGALSTKRDSTYSSMSENSGRTSPTNSCKSSAEGSLGSGGGSAAGSPVGGDAQGQVSFTVQFVLTNEARGSGRLIITILEAHGLPGRPYMGGVCDPYVKVIIWRERRSIRKIKFPPFQIFRTRTVKHTSDPTFNQSFAFDVNKSDLKDLVVKVVAMDNEKFASPTTLGEIIQPIRDMKTLATNQEKITLNFFLAPPKLEFGEVLFGLSYLPTAQRLSVSVIKANHLEYSNVVANISEFCPYVRVLLVSSSGRILRKKKTTFRANTNKPIWNETLIFDLAPHEVETVTFILAICTRPQISTNTLANESKIGLRNGKNDINSKNSHSQDPLGQKRQDKYLAKVVLGCHVPGEEERKHWLAVLAAPRKVSSQWHSLK